MYTLDVGQGDALLLVTPGGAQIVIDGGPNLDLLSHLGTHLPFFDRTIELVVLSHPDADHVTALPEVLRRYRVNAVLMSGAVQRSGRYEALLALLASHAVPILPADPAQDIVFDDGTVLDVVWPPTDVFGREQDEPNDASVVFRVLARDTRILLTGDIGKDAEQGILASGADVEADILKVPHHGSRTSSSTGFLLAVAPKLAVLSAGRNNTFGHPHADVMDRYKQLGIPIRNTQHERTIPLEW
jgi:competence protein ComEC